MTLKQFIRLFVATLAIAVVARAVSGTGLAQAAPAGTTIVVTDGSDSDPCTAGSLRCAIVYANANAFTTIHFTSGLPAVLLQTALPTITGDGTWIDGQDINSPRIDGSLAGSWTGNNGLTIGANAVTISNMKIVNIPTGADISIVGGKDIEISY
jgi:hypothetical protein